MTAENLRSRATALRAVARRLDAALVLDLYRRSGPDAWEGATPRSCHADLLTARRIIFDAVADLRHGARILEDRASQIQPPTVESAG